MTITNIKIIVAVAKHQSFKVFRAFNNIKIIVAVAKHQNFKVFRASLRKLKYAYPLEALVLWGYGNFLSHLNNRSGHMKRDPVNAANCFLDLVMSTEQGTVICYSSVPY
jgi:hypothetical protein